MHPRRLFIATLSASAFAAEGKKKTILLQSAWDTVKSATSATRGTLHIIEQHLPDVHVILGAMKLDGRKHAGARRGDHPSLR